ncbi:MAG: pyridoxamine 5'-phosphate oxidase family protein [Candidatus Aceula meridiana]|nr:pyridoxamine 5'-phosphate oxidase family protein [Candidatus Aceula meridiana]
MNTNNFKKLLNKIQFIDVATANSDGYPNSAPKLILKIPDEFIYLVDCTIGKTWENLKRDSRVSLSFVDQESLKGYQVKGVAKIIEGDGICQQLVDDLQEKEMALTVTRLISGIRDKKRHEDFEIGMSNKFVIFKVTILEVVEIGYKGNLTRNDFKELLKNEG